MTRRRKNHAWPGLTVKWRTLLYLLILTTLVKGATSQRRSYTRSNETEENQIIFRRNNDVSNAFDGLENYISKGGAIDDGKSLRFRLGERFAFRKRLQFALLPIMYKMGVMTTLLTGLTILVLKGLTIGVILLIFAFGNYFSKLHKHSYQSQQPIHVHVHSQDGEKVSSYSRPVGPWDREADEVHPGAFLTDEELESYRRRLIQNSAASVRLKPLL